MACVLVLLCACAPSLPRIAAPPESVAARDPGRLRVASFNAWILPVASEDLSARMKRMPRAIARLNLDICCLQEVWLVDYQSALERSLKAHFPYSVRSSGGLLILSRYPIAKRTFHSFPPAGGLPPTEWVADKGVLEAIVSTPQGPVRLVTTHMALDIGGEQKGRRTQLRYLGTLVQKWQDLPLIIAGDFNVPAAWMDKLTPDYKAIQRWGLLDTNPPQQRDDGSFKAQPPTRVGWPPERRDCILFQWAIDYILYRNAACGGAHLTSLGQSLHFTQPHEALSDHHLVLAEFALTGL